MGKGGELGELVKEVAITYKSKSGIGIKGGIDSDVCNRYQEYYNTNIKNPNIFSHLIQFEKYKAEAEQANLLPEIRGKLYTVIDYGCR